MNRAGDESKGPPREVDRRSRPTPMLSRYWLRGRRRGSGEDGYVDCYAWWEWTIVWAIIALAVADLGFTIAYLEQGGDEANPIMRFVLRGGYVWFAVVKMVVTVGGLFFVLVHIRFGRVRWFLVVLLILSLALLAYHIYLRQQYA